MNSKSLAFLLALGALAPAASAQFTSALPMNPGGTGTGSGAGGFLGGDPCATLDDGTTENALGLTNGGWICHLQYIDCLGQVDEILTAYGTLSQPAGITNGRPARIVLWADSSADENPTTGLSLQQTVNTTVTNGSTDMLNAYPIPFTALPVAGWIGAVTNHSVGEFPAPMDTTTSSLRSWTFGNANPATGIDLANIQNNNVAPTDTTAIMFPTVWMIRADGAAGPPIPGTGFCFCDPTSANPSGPCGNAGTLGNGCANGVSADGANLSATGTTSPDTIVFTAVNLQPNQACLFFQGTNAIAGGDGVLFGDGLRCAGQNIIRLQIVTPDATGTATTNIAIGTKGMVGPGDGLRYYQAWYRNPSNSPCGNGFNLSNGYEINW